MDSNIGFQGLFILIVVLIALIVFGFLGYIFYKKYKKSQQEPDIEQQEIQKTDQKKDSQEFSNLRLGFRNNDIQESERKTILAKNLIKKSGQISQNNLIKVDTIPEIYKSQSKDNDRNLYIKRLTDSSVLSVRNNIDNPDSDDVSDSSFQVSLSNNITAQNHCQSYFSKNFEINVSPFLLHSSRSSQYEIQFEQESSFNAKRDNLNQLQSQMNNNKQIFNRFNQHKFRISKKDQFEELDIELGNSSVENDIRFQLMLGVKIKKMNELNTEFIQQSSIKPPSSLKKEKQKMKIKKSNKELNTSVYGGFNESINSTHLTNQMLKNNAISVLKPKKSIFAKDFKIQTKEEFEKCQLEKKSQNSSDEANNIQEQINKQIASQSHKILNPFKKNSKIDNIDQINSHGNLFGINNEIKQQRKHLKEQYSESEEESDYNSSIEKQFKKSNQLQLQDINNNLMIDGQVHQILSNHQMSGSHEIQNEDKFSQNSLQKRRSMSLGNIYDNELEKLNQIKQQIINKINCQKNFHQQSSFKIKKYNKSQFSKNSKWAVEKKIEAIKFLQNAQRALSKNQNFPLEVQNNLTPNNQIDIQKEKQKLEIQQIQKYKTPDQIQIGKSEQIQNEQKQFFNLNPAQIVRRQSIFQDKDEIRREILNSNDNSGELSQEEQHRIKKTAKIRQKLYQKSSITSQIINKQIRLRLKNQSMDRLSNPNYNIYK